MFGRGRTAAASESEANLVRDSEQEASTGGQGGEGRQMRKCRGEYGMRAEGGL